MAFQELADQIRQLQRRTGELQGDVAQHTALLDALDALSKRLPYAMAAGRVTVSVSGNYTTGIIATLPAGKFTQPPIATVNLAASPGPSAKDVPRVYIATTSALTIGVWTGDGSQAAAHGMTLGWQAVQMTQGAAEG